MEPGGVETIQDNSQDSGHERIRIGWGGHDSIRSGVGE